MPAEAEGRFEKRDLAAGTTRQNKREVRVSERSIRLARSLEALYRRADIQARVARDPLVFPHRFSDPADIEIVGWIASALAYGRVELFQAAMERILNLMGSRPRAYVARFDPSRDAAAYGSLYYRMNRGQDIACLVYLIQQVLERHGSVGTLFASLYDEREPNIGPTLDRFVDTVLGIDTTPIYGNRALPRGLSQFFPKPLLGSACKRLNLYLRWMVRRDDGLDFGLWKDIPPSKLVVPLDAHVLRIGRYLGLTRRKTASWTAALEVTEALKRVDAEDPLRFDFPLCHHGISGECPLDKAPVKCAVCPLLTVCGRGRMLAGQRAAAASASVAGTQRLRQAR